jgi:hypothetical protein
VTQFETMGISSSILQAINDIGYETPTEIQSNAITESLNGKDILAQVSNGSTLLFGVPLIQNAEEEARGVQGLVLTSTPESCLKIVEELANLAKHTPYIRIVAAYGGQPIEKQIADLREIPHIVVGTPARLLEHLDRGTIRLYHIRMSVIDSADTLLDMGFQDEIESILDQVPSGRQMLIFSKTMPPKVMNLAHEYLKTPCLLDVQPIADAPIIDQPKTEAASNTEDEKTETLIKTIKSTVEEGGLATYTELLDRIAETLNPRIIAAALLKLHLENKPKANLVAPTVRTGDLSFSRDDLEQASIRPGKIRLMLNVGRRDGVSVKEVLHLFATETGLTSYFLGDIVLGDTATYVDVPEDKIPVVFKGLTGILHNETPLAIRLVHKIRDAAQLQRDMAEQRSRRPDNNKRFEGNDRKPQNNRRFPNNQRPARDKDVIGEASETPVIPAQERRQPQERDRKPREKYAGNRSDSYRKPTSGLPPYFPASTSSLGTPRQSES